MLKNVDPRLSAEALYVLHMAGHGDDILIVDRNFPADRVARQTIYGKPVFLKNIGTTEAVEAMLSVMPLDNFVEQPALRMQVVTDPDSFPPVQAEVQEVIDKAEGRSLPMRPVERFAFYDAARAAYAVISTSEARLFGCFIFKKGTL